MALLQDIKNEEALNCGFENKIRIYKSEDEKGNNKSGITSFEFTRKIIAYYEAGNTTWNYEQILERKEYLISKIEEMLDINREDVNLKITEESTGGRTGKSKWLYKDVYYDNAKLVRALVHDYIVDNNIQNYLDIPESIRSFKMYSHELIIDESNELLKNYSYTKVEANGITIYVRSICQKENTNEFINVLKQVYDFKLETIEDVG